MAAAPVTMATAPREGEFRVGVGVSSSEEGQAVVDPLYVLCLETPPAMAEADGAEIGLLVDETVIKGWRLSNRNRDARRSDCDATHMVGRWQVRTC